MTNEQNKILRHCKKMCLGLRPDQIVKIASELIGWVSETERQGMNVEKKN